mmetsp:Transcript_59147/g.105130  ORF Transcript_59147/g.105130 Transcript_59147/m.105130 type:complete len:190 (-) Transcript_59147:159-728(-)|eukprot:CAMPEP_0197624528 /NCGR_PEP_ID=MMETSP1338-20131121/4127_1 /TAXON_ID=43686 ORGANISM="Pelagodinium beii, Strain RCC1491" /NCGR_SAMPLE_ID=MMETSP1338 /ASSEMBLY_ACC=CAM_ASM_000754 /LENGTH=189 /DNA_ID=CAMNT_0043194673 /DNA_START=37 /DNA_END=606 /DNA_ORIENTATION=+
MEAATSLPPSFQPLDKRDPFGGGKATIFAGSFRPSRSKSAALVAAASLSNSRGLSTALGSGKPASEGRLGTGQTSSRPMTGSSAEDDIWDLMAPIASRDHVGNLMQQPLPAKGDGIQDYTKECSVGALPVAPSHLALIPSSVQGCYIFDGQFKSGLRAQKASEQWRGFPKTDQTEFNEARVKMGHIMRK